MYHGCTLPLSNWCCAWRSAWRIVSDLNGSHGRRVDKKRRKLIWQILFTHQWRLVRVQISLHRCSSSTNGRSLWSERCKCSSYVPQWNSDRTGCTQTVRWYTRPWNVRQSWYESSWLHRTLSSYSASVPAHPSVSRCDDNHLVLLKYNRTSVHITTTSK